MGQGAGKLGSGKRRWWDETGLPGMRRNKILYMHVSNCQRIKSKLINKEKMRLGLIEK